MSNRPLRRTIKTLEEYIQYSPPTIDMVEDSERGIDIPYSDAIADELFIWLSSGRSVVSYCQQPGKPARSLILTWLTDTEAEHDYLRMQFERGNLNRALALVDESMDVAEEPLLSNSKGAPDMVAMLDKKQRLEARLKLAALLDPAKYAPMSKTAQQVTLNQVNLTKNNVVELTDDQLQQIINGVSKIKSETTASGEVVVEQKFDLLEGS